METMYYIGLDVHQSGYRTTGNLGSALLRFRRIRGLVTRFSSLLTHFPHGT